MAASVGDFTDLSDAPVTKRWLQVAVSAYFAVLNDEPRFDEIPVILRIAALTVLVGAQMGPTGPRARLAFCRGQNICSFPEEADRLLHDRLMSA